MSDMPTVLHFLTRDERERLRHDLATKSTQVMLDEGVWGLSLSELGAVRLYWDIPAVEAEALANGEG